MGQAAPKTEGVRAKAAAMLGAGATVVEICAELEIHRATLWKWRRDPAFAQMVDEVVKVALAEAAQQMHALAPLAIDAFERGLRSPKDPIAVRTADIVTRRIPELMPRSGLEVELDASDRLAALIRRLDGDDGAGTADGGPLPPPPRPTAVRRRQPADPDQT